MSKDLSSLVGALLVLLFGLGASVAAVWYRMRRMENAGEFDKIQDPKCVRPAPKGESR